MYLLFFTTSHMLAMSNVTCNPFVYFWLNKVNNEHCGRQFSQNLLGAYFLCSIFELPWKTASPGWAGPTAKRGPVAQRWYRLPKCVSRFVDNSSISLSYDYIFIDIELVQLLKYFCLKPPGQPTSKNSALVTDFETTSGIVSKTLIQYHSIHSCKSALTWKYWMSHNLLLING